MEMTHDQPTIPDHNVPLQGECDMKDNNTADGKSIIPEKIEFQFNREMEKKRIREEIIVSELIRQELEAEVRRELRMEPRRILGDMKDNNTADGKSIIPEKIEFQLNREMEKKRIRDETIASELIRHKLEAEVRRELMMERNPGRFSNIYPSNLMEYGFSGSSYRPNYDNYLMSLGTSEAEMRLISGPSDEYLRPSLHRSENYGSQPFDRNPGFAALERANAELTDEAALSATVIGVKRKAESPARASDKEEMTPTVSIDSQKWFCSICEISTTSEATLNSHYQGKKHKSKAARSQVNITTVPTAHTLSDAADSSSAVPLQQSVGTKKWECSLCQIEVTCETLLTSHFQGKKHRAKAAKFEAGEIIAKSDGFPSENVVDTDKKWYCSVCGVTASCENNLNDHLKGRKHKAKAGLNQETSEKVPIVKIVKSTNSAGGDDARDELKEDTEKEVSNDSSQDIVSVTAKTNESELSGEFVKYWHCKMCDKGTNDEEAMAAHRKSEEHLAFLKEHGGGLISVVTVPKKAIEGEGNPREGLSANEEVVAA